MLCKDSASSSPFMAPVAEHLTWIEQRRPPAPQKFDTARNLGSCVISCSYIFYPVPIFKSIEQPETKLAACVRYHQWRFLCDLNRWRWKWKHVSTVWFSSLETRIWMLKIICTKYVWWNVWIWLATSKNLFLCDNSKINMIDTWHTRLFLC